MYGIDQLKGKTFNSVFRIKYPDFMEKDEIIFYVNDQDCYVMYHTQHQRERVYIEDIAGDLNDLIGSPILLVEESKGEIIDPDKDIPNYDIEEQQWTHYKLATIKGYVEIRWFGTCKHYYTDYSLDPTVRRIDHDGSVDDDRWIEIIKQHNS